MKIFRSILPIILLLVTTLLVSCGGPTASAPPTYTPEKLAQIKTYRISVDKARERMPELSDLIQEENWVDTRTFIHGPLGLIRRNMTYLSNALLEEDAKKATPLAKEVFKNLDDIDAAAKESNYSAAISEFNQAIRSFDAYLDLIPQTEEEAAVIQETEQTVGLTIPTVEEAEETEDLVSEAKEMEDLVSEMEVNG
ncbi:MAG: photosystem II protein PsbQ [Xenococcaceae cyanobacterium MO_188.B29]|nr:photosystem II protein PsbQ [Xenococcaceae cyanobacterium MO_188.B29]